jgi:hypothetical protein
MATELFIRKSGKDIIKAGAVRLRLLMPYILLTTGTV